MEKRKVLIDFAKWLYYVNGSSEIEMCIDLVERYLKSINTEEKLQNEDSEICKDCVYYIDDFPLEGCSISNLSACKGKFHEPNIFNDNCGSD